MRVKRIITIFLISIFIVGVISCRKKKSNPPYYEDEIVYGEFFIINEDEVNSTLNVTGGDIDITGNTRVNTDINIKDTRSIVYVSDNVSLHHVNINKGTLHLDGSPSIDNDLNMHHEGRVIIGSKESLEVDTVTIGGNFNFADSLWIVGGVLVIEHDLNQNEGGFINIADGAKLIVKNHLNQGGDIYGSKGVEARVRNHNNGRFVLEPYPTHLYYPSNVVWY